MSPIKRGWPALAALAAIAAGTQLIPAAAVAEPTTTPSPTIEPSGAVEVLHNVTYRARVDGISRGATISYAVENGQTQSATPTMVPGRTFEVNTVLPESGQARVRVSIQWPYSANLHCEILVDDMLVAQADDFVGPRALPAKDDPDYGALTCEAPVAGLADPVPSEQVPGTPAPVVPEPVTAG